MNVAIVGATGAVGQEFAAVLAIRGFPARSYRLLASPRSAGRTLAWCGRACPVEPLRADSFAGIDVALFSAGAAVSREYAPHAVRAGAIVIDNSSAFRLEPDVPLIVPEVNAAAAAGHRGVLANPNCSTIIMATALWPLHRRNPIRRVVVSTYQAASGAGARALAELESQTRAVLSGGEPSPDVFPEPCAFNVFSHNSPITADGANGEEAKMAAETQKIFATAAAAANSLRPGESRPGESRPGAAGRIEVAATCMRVPVLRAHVESLAVEFGEPIDPAQARAWLAEAPGLEVVDDVAAGRFPTSLRAAQRDEVLVGRIRRDPSVPGRRGLLLLCAGDQLRKGAALNAVQIAELLGKEGGAQR